MKFRTTNHRLPIETGRWQGLPLCDRICTLCKNNQIADEFHYILECKTLSNVRKNYLGNYYSSRPNVIKFMEIMSTSNEKMMKKLCIFIQKIYAAVCPP